MYTKKRNILAGIALTILMLLHNIAAVAASSAPVVGGKQCNIYLVVDSSGSLTSEKDPETSSDPDGHRYNALEYFFSIMPNSVGHEMGASVFSSAPQEVTALEVISSQAEKDAIKAKIEAVRPAGNTDIGAALLQATQALIARQQAQDSADGKHKESWVLLFTDGLTDTGSPAGNATSEEKRDQAIALALENGIHIAGVFLNDKGSVTKTAAAEGKNPQEVFDIVRAGRGQAADPFTPKADDGASNNLDGYFAEIIHAADIAGAFNTLAHTILGGSNPTIESVPVDKEQLIPGIGVAELIFSVRYAPDIKDKVLISILSPDPDRKPYFSAGDNVSIKSNDVFYSANVKDPAPGTWYIHVGRGGNTPVTEEIQVIPDILISTDVVAKLEQAPAAIKKGEPFQVNAWLEKQGERITDNAKYTGYDVSLTLVNPTTQKAAEPISMGSDGKGTFVASAKVDDFSAYSAYVTFSCGDNISFRSESILLKADNQPPELRNGVSANAEGTLVKDTYRFSLFSSGNYTIDLNQLVIDPDGDTALRYTSVSEDYAVADIPEGSSALTVKTGKTAGIGVIQINAADNDGKSFSFDLELTAKNVTIYWLIGIIGAILLLLILILLIRKIMIGTSIPADMLYEIEGISRPYLNNNGPEIRVGKMGDLGTPFNLYALCQKFAKRAKADPGDFAALDDFFTKYKPILQQCTFKARAGYRCFTFSKVEEDGSRSKIDGEPGNFHESIKLDDDLYLRLECPSRRDEPGRKKDEEKYDY